MLAAAATDSESSKVLRTVALRLVAGAAAVCIALAGCRGPADDGAATADSALARDLTLATAVAASTPELRDIPDTTRRPAIVQSEQVATVARKRAPTPRRTQPMPVESTRPPEPSPAPVVEAPEPTPEPAPAPASAATAVAAGTSIGLTLGERTCSDANRPGDKMVAQTAHPVTGTNGVVYPAGSTVVLEVASVVRSADEDSATITFRVRSITADGATHPLAGEVVPEGTLEKRRSDTGGADRKKVVTGAILGAVIGRVAGGGARGTVVGAAAGAAVGAAAANAMARYETCVPAGAALRLTVREMDPST